MATLLPPSITRAPLWDIAHDTTRDIMEVDDDIGQSIGGDGGGGGGTTANAMVDEAGSTWVDEAGNIMVAS